MGHENYENKIANNLNRHIQKQSYNQEDLNEKTSNEQKYENKFIDKKSGDANKLSSTLNRMNLMAQNSQKIIEEKKQQTIFARPSRSQSYNYDEKMLQFANNQNVILTDNILQDINDPSQCEQQKTESIRDQEQNPIINQTNKSLENTITINDTKDYQHGIQNNTTQKKNLSILTNNYQNNNINKPSSRKVINVKDLYQNINLIQRPQTTQQNSNKQQIVNLNDGTFFKQTEMPSIITQTNTIQLQQLKQFTEKKELLQNNTNNTSAQIKEYQINQKQNSFNTAQVKEQQNIQKNNTNIIQNVQQLPKQKSLIGSTFFNESIYVQNKIRPSTSLFRKVVPKIPAEIQQSQNDDNQMIQINNIINDRKIQTSQQTFRNQPIQKEKIQISTQQLIIQSQTTLQNTLRTTISNFSSASIQNQKNKKKITVKDLQFLD